MPSAREVTRLKRTPPARLLREWVKAACAHRPMSNVVCWRVATREPLVALTFDDGPTADATPQVLEMLGGAGAVATFFVIGKLVDENPELVARARAAGHEFGNHSHTHRTEGLPQQVSECGEVLGRLGITTTYFRPPRGQLPFGAFLRLWYRGYRTVFWSFDARDSMRAEGKWPDQRPNYERIAAGDIVLMHDDNARCVEELPLLLSAVKARGLRPVTLSELFEKAAAGG